jgi:hypothetical protein
MSYIALATTTLSSSASSVTFSSIPSSVGGVALRDLVVVYNGSVPGGGDLRAVLNSDGGSNYSFIQMSGDGSSTFSSSAGNTFLIFTFTAGVGETSMIANIMDYSATNKHKTCISRGNQATGRTMAYATRWANTNAITSMSISHAAGNLPSGARLSLYGIAG